MLIIVHMVRCKQGEIEIMKLTLSILIKSLVKETELSYMMRVHREVVGEHAPKCR